MDGINIAPLQAQITLDLQGFQLSLRQAQGEYTAFVQRLAETVQDGTGNMREAGYALYDAMLSGMQSAFSQVQQFVQSSADWIAQNTAQGGISAGISYAVAENSAVSKRQTASTETAEPSGRILGNVQISVQGGISEKQIARRIRDELGRLMEV